jgi:D-glycero-alpha-D-manno-heptose-7-phosphate kinase
MRISFVGGGTDLPSFYRKHPGKVISTAIDKFVYIAINRTPLVKKVSARYSISETVDHPAKLQNTRIKAALYTMGITHGLEIGSFAPLPTKTGLGSSSSFSVALIKALHAYQGKKIGTAEVAEAASRLEIDLVGEPIGKQDQYAAAFGGFNVITFNPDDTVSVEPVLIDFQTRLGLEDHMSLFFTGITRDAASVLTEQKANTDKKFETLKAMAYSVDEFKTRLLSADFHGLGVMLQNAWEMKKTLASNVSSTVIDDLYQTGMQAGAWGGKILGAGGGGCILFLSPIEKKPMIQKAMMEMAKVNHMEGFVEVPIKLVQSGSEIIFNGDQHYSNFS